MWAFFLNLNKRLMEERFILEVEEELPKCRSYDGLPFPSVRSFGQGLSRLCTNRRDFKAGLSCYQQKGFWWVSHVKPCRQTAMLKKIVQFCIIPGLTYHEQHSSDLNWLFAVERSLSLKGFHRLNLTLYKALWMVEMYAVFFLHFLIKYAKKSESIEIETSPDF